MNRLRRTNGACLASLMLGVATGALLCAAAPAEAARSSTVALNAVSSGGQTYRTDASSWREVLLPDGTSITLGPNTSATVSAFRFDPATGERTLRLSVTGGRVRVTSGFKAAAAPIEITTPFGTTTLQNGAAIVRVEGTATSATLLFGTSVTVSSPVGTQTILRPGFASRTAGGAPEAPLRLTPEELAAELAGVTPPPDVRMTERSAPSREANCEERERAPDGRERCKRKKSAKAKRRPVAQAALFTLPVVQNQAGRSSLASATGGLEPDANRRPDNNGNFTGSTPNTGGNGPGGSAPGGSGPGGSPGGGTSNSNPPTSISLALGGGLGGTSTSANALPTETASGTTPAGGSRVFGNLGAIRARLDPAERLNLPYNYTDQRFLGAPFQAGPAIDKAGGDTTLNQYIVGFSNGINYDSSRYRYDYFNYGSESLFANPTSLQLYYDRISLNKYFDTAETVSNTVQRFLQTVSDPSAPNSRNFSGLNYTADSKVFLVGSPAGATPVFDNSNNPDYVVVNNLPVVRFYLYDLTTNNGQRLLAFGGPKEGATETAEFVYNGSTSNPVAALGLGLPGSGALPNLPGTNISPTTEFTLTRYRISDGLQGFTLNSAPESQGQIGNNFDRNGTSGFLANNAFRREATFVQGSPRGDTDLLITTLGATNSVLRSDLQITQDGRSNISLTVGTITASSVTVGNSIDGRHAMNGYLIGSTRASLNDTSIQISGPVGSLGSGPALLDPHFFGGNASMFNDLNAANAPTTDDLRNNPALRATERIGYFLIGPTDNNNPVASASIAERAANGDTTSYSYTRLAVGHDKLDETMRSTVLADRAAAVAPTVGYVAAIGESVRSTNGTQPLNLTSLVGTATLTGNVVNSIATNTIAVTVNLNSTDLGTGQPDRTLQLNLGGTNATSAYIGSKLYGAQTAPSQTGPAVGLIVAPNDLKAGIADRANIRDNYQYVQWGYFFGDVVKDTNGRTDHVNLGYLVAGSPTDPNTIRLQGSATYDGHIAGTVYSGNGGLQDRVGTFTNAWSFDQRQGTVTANFADRNYAGTVASPDVANRHLMNGILANDAGQSTLQMNGRFFGPVNGSGTPPEMGGTVSVRPTAGAVGQPSAQYGQGIFIGRLR